MSGSPDPRAAISRMMQGYAISQSLSAVARLGVADVMPPGEPVPAADIAARVGADEGALYRVMRVLAAEGVFSEGPRHTFTLTQVGELLRDDTDGTERYTAIWNGEQMYPVWGHLVEAVRKGTPMAERVWGKSYFDHLAERPEEAEIFNRVMQGGAASRGASALSELDWSSVRTVVDVGGGTGGMLLGLLDREPHLRGILFDLPHVADQARAAIAAAGLEDRCEFVGGSFFDAVPADGDLYLLAGILNDWDDADAARILQVCRRATRDGARLVVVQPMVPDGDEPHPAKVTDVHMLAVLGSRMQSEGELRGLLAATGFRAQRTIEGVGGVAVEAVTA